MEEKRKFIALALAAFSFVATAAPGDVDTSWQDSGHIKTMPQFVTFPSALLADTVAAPDGGFFQVGSVNLLGGSGETIVMMAKFDSAGFGDGTFGSGQSNISVVDRSLFPSEAVVQPDGKLIVVGAMLVKDSDNLDMFVCRVNTDGNLDLAFATDSSVPGCATNLPSNDMVPKGIDLASSVVLRPDGGIIVAGTVEAVGGHDAAAVLQLLPNGSVDPTFGNVDAQHQGLSLFAMSDRDIAAADVGVVLRGGKVSRIVVAGRWTPTSSNNTDMLVAKFDAQGKIDAGFGDAMTKGARGIAFDIGSNRQDAASKLAIASNGSIVVAGSVRVAGLTDHVGVARLKADGSLDAGFGANGRVVHAMCDGCTQSPLRDMAMQVDGRIVLVGSIWGNTFQDIGVMRLSPSGAEDGTFTGDGRTLNFIFTFLDQTMASSDDRGASVMLLDDAIYVGGSIQRDFSPDKRNFSLTRLKMN